MITLLSERHRGEDVAPNGDQMKAQSHLERLSFHEPTWLNNLKEPSSVVAPDWDIQGPEGPLPGFLDLGSMTFWDESGETSFSVNEARVDEDSRVFYKANDAPEHATEVGFTFACSMLGQIASGPDLVNALARLKSHFGIASEDGIGG